MGVMSLTLLLVALCGSLAWLPAFANAQEPAAGLHPFTASMSIEQRINNALNYPRRERNFCCCYCGDDGTDYSITAHNDDDPLTVLDATDLAPTAPGASDPTRSDATASSVAAALAEKRSAPPLRWYFSEELEPYCGFDHCQTTFPSACKGADTVVFSGATGVGDYTRAQSGVSVPMVQARCEAVMKESSAWWSEFVGLAAGGMD